MDMEHKFRVYYLTAIFSLLFAVIGFSYNTWRLEATEDNNNVRTAAFEVLIRLSDFEQHIYSAHFDQNLVEGNPRKGWVMIGLIVDLSTLIDPVVERKAIQLKDLWAENWEAVPSDRSVTEALINTIESVRAEIKTVLHNIE